MRRRWALAAIFLAVFSTSTFPTPAKAGDHPVAPVREALAKLEQYLDSQPTGKGWRDYLDLAALKTELDKGAAANPLETAPLLKLLEGDVPGLELEPFAGLRGAVAAMARGHCGGPGGERPGRDRQERSDLLSTRPRRCGNGPGRIENRHGRARSVLEGQPRGRSRLARIPALEGSRGAGGCAQPDVETLKTIDTQFSTDANGLEMPVFTEVRKAAKTFVELLLARGEDLRPQYIEHLKSLSENVKRYEADKSNELADAIGSDLAWLEAMHLGAPLVRDIRSRLSTPNLHVRISSHLISAGAQQALDETGPITDNILGTAISGTAHTRARSTADRSKARTGQSSTCRSRARPTPTRSATTARPRSTAGARPASRGTRKSPSTPAVSAVIRPRRRPGRKPKSRASARGAASPSGLPPSASTKTSRRPNRLPACTQPPGCATAWKPRPTSNSARLRPIT